MQKSSRGGLERQRLRIERRRQVADVKNVLPEAADVLTRVGVEAADQGGRSNVPVTVHRGQGGGHVNDVGEHYRFGDEACVFELLFLFYGIAALDHGPAERDPVEGLVESLDLGGFGTDRPPDVRVGDEPQQEQRAFSAADLAKCLIEQAVPVVGAKLAQQYGRRNPPRLDRQHHLKHVARAAIRFQSISALNSASTWR